MRIGLELLEIPEHRATTILILQEYVRHTARHFSRYLPKGHHISGSGWALNLEVVAQIVMKLLKRLDEQVVDREPNGATPVGVAPKQSRRRLAGLIVDAVLHALRRKLVRIVTVKLRQGPNAIRREELALVQHELENASELISVGDGQQSPLAHALGAHAGKILGEIRTIINEPLKASLEVRQLVQHLRFQRFHREQRNQSHHGADLHRELFAIGQLEHVIEEAVFFVPQTHAFVTAMAHRVSDVDEVFPELAGDVFVAGLFFCELKGDREQIEGVHRHPAGAVRLFDVATGGQRRAAVEHTDVVQAQEAALEDVHAIGV